MKNIPTPNGRIQFIIQKFATFRAALDVYRHAYETRTLEVIPVPSGPFDKPINEVFEDAPNSDGKWDSTSVDELEDGEGWAFADSDEEILVRLRLW